MPLTSPAFIRSIFSAVLFLLTIAAYEDITNAPFVFDDFPAIVNNDAIRTLNPVTVYSFQSSRFLVMYSFAINYAVSGLNPFYWHLTNILIHLLCSAAVYWFSLNLITHLTVFSAKNKFPAESTAYLSALIFALHPIQTEAVSYIWQRNTSLAALFYMLSVTCFLRFSASMHSRKKKRLLIYGFAGGLSGVLSALSKEFAITLPAMCLLLEWCRHKKLPSGILRMIWPWSLPLILIPFLLVHGDALQVKHMQGGSLSGAGYLIHQAEVVFRYLALLFVPRNQSIAHDVSVRVSPDLPLILSVSGHIILITFLISQRKRISPWILACAGFFCVTMSVESTVVPLKDLMFEHRLYLPMAGISLAAACFLTRAAWATPFPRALAVLLSCILAHVLLTQTVSRNQAWKSPESLWRDAVAKAPRSQRALQNLGTTLMREGKTQEALPVFLSLTRMWPQNPLHRLHYGTALIRSGKISEAAAQIRMSGSLSPGSGLYLYGSALLELHRGNTRKSAKIIAILRNSSSLPQPSIPPVYLDLLETELLEKAGRTKEAFMIMDRLLQREPGNPAFLKIRNRLSEAKKNSDSEI